MIEPMLDALLWFGGFFIGLGVAPIIYGWLGFVCK
jgi:hypothetical protein